MAPRLIVKEYSFPKWIRDLLWAAFFDALASILFKTVVSKHQSLFWTRLLLYIPTGGFFVSAVNNGVNVGVGIALFGVFAMVTNSFGGLAIGELPKDWILFGLGMLLAVVAFAVGTKSRTQGSKNAGAIEQVIWGYIPAIICTIGALAGMPFLAVIAFIFTDSSGAPLAEGMEKIYVKVTQKMPDNTVSWIFGGLAFIPSSFVFSLILDHYTMTQAGVMAGLLSMCYAPIFEHLVYGSKQKVGWTTVTLILGILSVAILNSAF